MKTDSETRAEQAEARAIRAESKLQQRSKQIELEERRSEILAKRLRKVYETLEAAGGMFLLSGAQKEFWRSRGKANWTEGNPDNIDGAA